MKKLKAINREKLLLEDQLNYDLYHLNLERSINGFPYHPYLIPVTQLGGVHIGLPNMVELMPFKTAKDYQNYLSRLEQIPNAIDQTIAVMKEGIKKGWVPPRITLESVPDQIRKQFEFDSILESPFYAPFSDNINDIDNWMEIVEKGSDLIQNGIFLSYQNFHRFFVEEYLPKTRDEIGASSLPDGEEYYQHLIRHHTTTQLTAEQIHNTGLEEVERIHAEMVDVMKASGWGGSFADFLTFLRTDSQFYYDNEQDLLTGYRDICKRADPELAKLFGTLPRTPYGVKPIPDYQAISSPTAYYYGPSSDGERPGYFWANTYNLTVRPKYEMEVLALHEAVPGHHLQIALANELENVPEFRKHSGYTAFVEGWALYSESLGEQMGMYEDPYSKFGQLTYEMWRACRLVIDTGIHAMGWTREQAITYMAENTAKTMYDIEVEIDRYIVWPGQALAYKIGELKIKEIRIKAEEVLGDRFNIREFHDHILKNGSIPLNILEEIMMEYIHEKSNFPSV